MYLWLPHALDDNQQSIERKNWITKNTISSRPSARFSFIQAFNDLAKQPKVDAFININISADILFFSIWLYVLSTILSTA